MLVESAAGAAERMTAEPRDLAGTRVLVLEDETLVSMMVEDMLADLACEVVGPFARLDQATDAVAALELPIDVALLDVNLGRQQSFPLAEILREKGVPFVFTTGYDDSGIPPEWRDRPALRKPFMLHHMKDALEKALG
jgi:DNA-binding response OmpR family regulator